MAPRRSSSARKSTPPRQHSQPAAPRRSSRVRKQRSSGESAAPTTPLTQISRRSSRTPPPAPRRVRRDSVFDQSVSPTPIHHVLLRESTRSSASTEFFGKNFPSITNEGFKNLRDTPIDAKFAGQELTKMHTDHAARQARQEADAATNAAAHGRSLRKSVSPSKPTLGQKRPRSEREYEHSPPLIRRRRWDKARPNPAIGPSYAIRCEFSDNIIDDKRLKYSYNNNDTEMSLRFQALQSKILQFAAGPSFVNEYIIKITPPADGDAGKEEAWLKDWATKLSPHFARIAGYIAVGGPCEIASWEELFVKDDLRIALVAGIVWKILKEHVFSQLLFGATQEQQEDLHELEKDAHEGFSRTFERGTHVRKLLSAKFDSKTGEAIQHNDPEGFEVAKTEVASGIFSTLLPLFKDINYDEKRIILAIDNIVHLAAQTSIAIRLDTDTVYFIPHACKDEYWHPDSGYDVYSEMHHDNIKSRGNDPKETPLSLSNGITKEVLDNINSYRKLVRITVFDRIDAYRRGGWRDEDREKGFRKKTLVRGKVALRWGRQRKFGRQLDNNYLEFRDIFRHMGEREVGKPAWWDHSVKDPAFGTTGTPVFGRKAGVKGGQVTLRPFEPREFVSDEDVFVDSEDEDMEDVEVVQPRRKSLGEKFADGIADGLEVLFGPADY